MIILQRDSGFADWARAYNLVLDGTVVGHIRSGKRIQIHCAPGAHTLKLEIDWCSSNTIEFVQTEHSTLFEVGSSLRGLGIFLGLFFVTLQRNEYLWLRQVHKDIR